MITDLSKYDDIPEGVDKQGLSKYLQEYFGEYLLIDRDQAIELLGALADKQWHTYEEPDASVKDAVLRCLQTLESDTAEFVEFALGVAYCFALRKEYFERLYEKFSWEDSEFRNMLENSKGENMDPYWSLS